MSNTINKVTVTFLRQECPDYNPDLSYLEPGGKYDGMPDDEIAKYEALDAARLKAYHDGEWSMVGIRAVAHIDVTRAGCTTRYTLESAGLWGIESDSDQSYLDSVFDGEINALKADIEAMRHAEFKV